MARGLHESRQTRATWFGAARNTRTRAKPSPPSRNGSARRWRSSAMRWRRASRATTTMMEPEMKWQPIETAPERAERYLVTDGYEVREARYMPRKTLWKFP